MPPRSTSARSTSSGRAPRQRRRRPRPVAPPPPGVQAATAAGFSVMPFTLQFEGKYLSLSAFFSELQKFVKVSNEKVDVTGRLLRVENFTLSPGKYPQLTAAIGATSYLVPAAQGVTGGATPQGPAAATPAASGGGTTPVHHHRDLHGSHSMSVFTDIWRQLVAAGCGRSRSCCWPPSRPCRSCWPRSPRPRRPPPCRRTPARNRAPRSRPSRSSPSASRSLPARSGCRSARSTTSSSRRRRRRRWSRQKEPKASATTHAPEQATTPAEQRRLLRRHRRRRRRPPRRATDARAAQKTYPPLSLRVRFDDGVKRTLPRLTALPSAEAPADRLHGPAPTDGKTAVFMLDSTLTAQGDGSCHPTPLVCETVQLRVGETEFFDLLDDTGGTRPARASSSTWSRSTRARRTTRTSRRARPSWPAPAASSGPTGFSRTLRSGLALGHPHPLRRTP